MTSSNNLESRGARRRPAFLVVVLLASLGASISAFATCGSANCFLVTGTEEGTNNEGALSLDLSFRYVDLSRKLDGSSSVGEVLTPGIDLENGLIVRNHHREISTLNTLMQLNLDYGITDRVTLFTELPFFNDRRHEHFDDVGEPTEHFTNGDGTSGFGDVRAGARWALAVHPKDILVGGLGLRLPTGPYRLRDGEGAINEPTIQPGTGATAVAASLYYAHHPTVRGGEWFASGSYQANQGNDLRYRIGAEAVLNIGLDRRLRGHATWSAQFNSRWSARDEFVGLRVPSTGATFVNFTPGLRLAASSGVSVYAYAQIPVYEHVNESNLGPRGGILLGISKLLQ
jgi:hypothetical protein